MRIGVIGCGMVSHAYLGTIARAEGLELVALASRTMISAEMRASQYGGRATTVADLLADPSIELVVVLAPPEQHHPLGTRVLEAGKHLYLEKPLATSLDDARRLLEAATARGLTIGCAPDTFLGEAQRHARRVLASGVVGTVVCGSSTFASGGVEGWHPSPASFYAEGAGPLLDIGPYHVTQLVDLLGPVERVTALAAESGKTRVGLDGTAIPVAVPTTVVGALAFASGAVVSLSLSWDAASSTSVPLELHGTVGNLRAADPNGFDGELRWSAGGREWREGRSADRPPLGERRLAEAVRELMAGVDPITRGPVDRYTALRYGDRRGIGVVDMAEAIADGRSPKAPASLAFHVLEVLLGLDRSTRDGVAVAITSRP